MNEGPCRGHTRCGPREPLDALDRGASGPGGRGHGDGRRGSGRGRRPCGAVFARAGRGEMDWFADLGVRVLHGLPGDGLCPSASTTTSSPDCSPK